MSRPAVEVQALHSTAATVDQAHRALVHLDYLTRTGAVDGPAEAYHVIGTCAQIASTMQPSLRHLAEWLADQHVQGGLVTEQGPFADDTAAAVAVSNRALSDARQACTDLHAALERAHLATAHVTAPADTDRSRRVRKSLWSLLTRR